MQREKTYRQRKRRWPLPRERWRVCAKLSKLLRAVVIPMAVLCLPGCATTQKTQTEQTQTDEVHQNRDSVSTVIRQRRRETVPGSRVDISIPVDSLLKLPSEATYTKHSGQASAAVSKRGEVIYVTATCDSLQREVEYYEELYYRARDALEQHQNDLRTAQEQRSEPLANPITIFIMGLVGGILMTITIILTKKRHGKE